MNEPSSKDASTPQIFAAPSAFQLGLLLIVGMILVLALAIFDRQRRPQLEGWQESTAVGDRVFFVPPSDTAATAVLAWEAGQLSIAPGERAEFRDTLMRRAGRAEADGITVYRHAAPPDAEVAARFYVKIAPGEYLAGVPAGK